MWEPQGREVRREDRENKGRQGLKDRALPLFLPSEQKLLRRATIRRTRRNIRESGLKRKCSQEIKGGNKRESSKKSPKSISIDRKMLQGIIENRTPYCCWWGNKGPRRRKGRARRWNGKVHLLHCLCEKPKCNLGFEIFEGDLFAVLGRNYK